MTETLRALAGWGPRLESAHDCAARMLQSPNDIPTGNLQDPKWYSFADASPKSKALVPLPDKVDDLTSVIESAALRDDRGRLMPQGGFHPLALRLASGSPNRYNVSCGVGGTPGNNVALQLPSANQEQLRLTEPDALRELLRALVRSWQPDHGCIVTRPFLKSQGFDVVARQIRVGWITYVHNTISLDLGKVSGAVNALGQDDGTYLTLAGDPSDPDLDGALSIRWALGHND